MNSSNQKAGWSVFEWRKSVGIGHTKACDLIAKGAVKSVRLGRRRIILTTPQEFLAQLAGEAA